MSIQNVITYSKLVEEMGNRVDALTASLELEDDPVHREWLANRLQDRVRGLEGAQQGLVAAMRAYEQTLPVPDRPLITIIMGDDTLGSIAEALRMMLAKGITPESIRYALAQADGSH